MADISIVGLLPAFSIGRIGCTVVSDHVGSVVDKAQWYAALAMNYPINNPTMPKPVSDAVACKVEHLYCVPDVAAGGAIRLRLPDSGETIPMWNLGLIELLYLIPVNALILWFAFRKKRMPTGFLVVLTGVLYAPVRFFLEYLRPVETDARHMGLTFAQWCSIAAFGVSVYAASRIMKNGKAAGTIAPTAGEAQKKLKVILKEDEEKADREEEEKRAEEKRVTDRKAAEDKAAKSKDADKKPEAKKVDDNKPEAKKADDNKAEKTEAKKTSGLAGKSEVPPTEPMIDALPKDIVKKVEDTKAKQAEEAKAEEAKAEKSDKADKADKSDKSDA
jgi:hypothetical protein